VATVYDPDIRGPSLLFDSAKLTSREPFRMQRAIVHLKRQVSDLQSSETDAHDQFILSG
jgi:hypothetical protein